MSFPTPVVVTLSILLASAAGGPPANDAGSRQDAGNTPGSAMGLTHPGEYHGQMASPDDPDWYRLTGPGTALACTAGRADGPARADLVLQLGSEARITRRLASAHAAGIGIAMAQAGVAHLALLARSTDYGAPPGENHGHGPYDFKLAVFNPTQPPPGEASLQSDAGSTPATALGVPGLCFQGHLDAATDASDWWAFDARAGDEVALSLALTEGASFALLLVAPDGDVVGAAGAGTVRTFRLEETGRWHAVVRTDTGGPGLSSTMNGDYYVGISQTGDPDPGPCRPTCDSGVGGAGPTSV